MMWALWLRVRVGGGRGGALTTTPTRLIQVGVGERGADGRGNEGKRREGNRRAPLPVPLPLPRPSHTPIPTCFCQSCVEICGNLPKSVNITSCNNQSAPFCENSPDSHPIKYDMPNKQYLVQTIFARLVVGVKSVECSLPSLEMDSLSPN